MSSDKAIDREQVLTATVERQRGRLLSFIQRMIQNQSEAEEVAQDVFAEFVEVYEIDTAIETVGAWLTTVARNKVLDRFRRRKTQDDYRLFVEEQPDAIDSDDPEMNSMRAELRLQIVTALESIPPEQKDVFVQHELEGKSFEEISAQTGVSVNTLLSRKRYAVLALREYLKEIYDEL
ncbi:MAG TPA: RNA polymerase sigma factor [Bdellovibrionales bacterium]|jgi:RNA polymerase sigma factor (sigma-70 family)|nr:RNA polymerase sigma factor [Bdellovibrionales bacterium]